MIDTYVRIWRDNNLIPFIGDLKEVKENDIFQTVDKLCEGPVLVAACDAFKSGKGYRVKTKHMPF